MAAWQSRLLRCLVAAALAALPAAAGAEGFPAKPIKIIVSSSAGSFLDIVARTYAQQLSERVGQPVVIDDRAGAAGQLATDMVAKASPDGYTLLVCSPGPVVVGPHASKLPYDPLTDLAPITVMARVATAIAANSALPVRDFRGFLDYARAHPGALSYSHSGNGSLMHLGGEELKIMARINMVSVPYRGAVAAGSAISAGETQVGFSDLLTLIHLAETGSVRILALADPTRSAFAPEIPTAAESGVPGYDAGGWAMLLAPARTPPEIVGRLNAEAKRAFDLPEVRRSLLKAAIDPAIISPEATAQLLRADYEKWGKVVREAGVKFD
ncbi:MAG TPA: tripartite tricarboxylate transporter substrate-binding protein [Alphaproteobacteria bacterium]